MRDWQSFGVLYQLSWLLAFSVLLPLILGIVLDRAFHSFPLFLLIGVIIGVVAGTVGAARIATQAIAEVEHRSANEMIGPPPKEDKAQC